MRKPSTYLEKYKYDKHKDKSVMFFSASSRGDAQFLYEFGIREILVSYFYIRKSEGYFKELTEKIHAEDGLFMTDSGAFSFMGHGSHSDEMEKAEYWLPYLESYVQYLHDNKKYIHCAANLDLDKIVGRDIVDEWNEKYFKPLEKDLQIIYVAHKDEANLYNDKNGLKRFKEYCTYFDFVGVNQTSKDYASQIYTIAKTTNTRVHGFAWTDIKLLRQFPLHSVDSTTWLGGVRYGTSYMHDGKNFRVIDYKRKHVRKSDKSLMKINGVNYEGVLTDKRKDINSYNMLGWLGAREIFLKSSNLKLSNKAVSFYAKNKSDA